MSERYIVAVEISSSKIIASVGKLVDGGRLDVIAMEQETGVDAVRYGIIQNLEETSVKISRLLARLEQHPEISPRKIKGVFVGLSGRSLRSITTEVVRNLPEDTEITDEIIQSLRNDAMRTAVDNTLEIVDVVPRIYKVGATETHTPKGMIGNRVEVTYDLVVCRPELKRNITRTLPNKLGIQIEGFVVTALATAHLILTPDEKSLGCMLVDMGAETTTVSIYKNGCLNYFATLPLGGRNITKDITSLNILEDKAEEIKMQSGKAIVGNSASSLNLNGLKLSDVNNLVVARSEEIVSNIVEQIEYAELKESNLPGGIICIGGAARLPEMMELLHRQSNLKVRRGDLPDYVKIEDPRGNKMENAEVISVMYAGATLSDRGCLETPAQEEIPKNGHTRNTEEEEIVEEPPRKTGRRGSFLDSLRTRVSSIFRSPSDDESDILE